MRESFNKFTYKLSGGAISAMHLTMTMVRTTPPPPMRAKRKDRRPAAVAQSRWNQTVHAKVRCCDDRGYK